MDNNILIFNGGRGLESYLNTSANVYFRHNTVYGNNTQTGQQYLGNCGEIQFNASSTSQAFLNLAETNPVTGGCDYKHGYAYQVTNGSSTDFMYQNVAYDATGNHFGSSSSAGYNPGPNNITVYPRFVGPVEQGAPSCASYASVPA